jgi:hypothetical protein
MKIPTGGPILPQYISPFHSYSELMKVRSGGPLLPLYIFLIQLLFKIDESTLWSPSPLFLFLVQFLFKIYENTHWRPHPPQVHILYSILILMKILSRAALIPKYIFLIHFLFKTDENTYWSPPPPPPVHISYSILI